MSDFSDSAIHIDNLSVKYDDTYALEGVNMDVARGEYLGIIGPNGGGKSTLLKAILGLIPIQTGSIAFYGQKPGRSRHFLGYVPQFTEFDRGFPINVLEVVLTGMLTKGMVPFRRYSADEIRKANTLLEKVGILQLARNPISALSGGEFQKMLLARALAVDPEILLLDEPTASVDASSREQIYNLLGELNKDVTIILVTHDLLAISSKVRRLACLNTRMIYHGDPELNEEVITNLYGCPVDLIAHGVPHRVLRAHGEGECNC
ncbi:MAG: metal ABC transporter ATP-binding protein [Saccharofermentanales bacterium]